MQSSFKVLKSAKVSESTIIQPPIIEVLYDRVLENNEAGFDMDEIYKSIVSQAEEEKNRIIENARVEAKKIIDSTTVKTEEIRKNAREEGYQEGYKAGYQEGYAFGINEANENTKTIRGNAEQYAQNCHLEVGKYIESSKENIINLAFIIAKKIINTEITTNQETVFKIAEEVLSKAVDKSQIIIRANPQDIYVLKSRKDELSIYVEDANNLLIIADPDMNHGSIKAETPSGFIDGSIDTQLDIILKKLIEE